ncbi:30S ribosomal protein S4 [Candidatus Gottesmanbacteria bacterium]|nr:30S ribosomal protein S4 [Candidatus Gottesmanbacteria bacterium]
MARYTGPKNRLARREGMDLGFQTVGSKSHASMLRRLNIPPGQHGAKGRRKISDYGLQLREKQKVKRMYGVLERQFRRYFENARKWRGNTGEKLLEFLERRLDNVVYRIGFVPTRSGARQLVSHGHVLVNGKKVNIPSYPVFIGQVISLKTKAMGIPSVKQMLDEKTFTPPEWLERKGPVGRVARLPGRSDVKEDISEQLIVEHYSR